MHKKWQPPMPTFRTTSLTAALVILASALGATSLEQLSLDDMIRQSSAIIRAKVVSSYPAQRGANVFTVYKLAVSETWKGSSAAQMEVAVPGGSLGGSRQIVAGAPVLASGQEYVVFVWTSPSGLQQVIGLSQGLFHVEADSAGTPVVSRAATAELMVDRNGKLVADQAVVMKVTDLRSRVRGGAR